MKLSTRLVLSTFLTTSLYANGQDTSQKPIPVKMEGIGYIKKLGGALKGELQKHMKADPTGVAALGFCTAKAGEITLNVNKELPEHAEVRRTALKNRSLNNMPDTTDKKVMEEYVQAIEAKTFSPKDIKVVEEGDVTRVYKPLVTGGVCLKCHGENVSTELIGMIKESYPKDLAMGFKEGELRGVIVAEIEKTAEK